MIAVFLGAPGSGKGTQAKRLSQSIGIPQLSTGDMLRASIAAGTGLGKRAKAFIDEGQLVPDEVVLGLIQERIKSEDCKSGFILDGFPRTVGQAEGLESMLENSARTLDCVVLFSIDERDLARRLTGRRTCERCGAMFHVDFQAPKVSGSCDSCGGSLFQRPDDQLDVIQKRMAVFRQQTQPLEAYYSKKGVMTSIDAGQSPDRVYSQLSQVLKLS
jgi:adenylate kinase